MLLRNSHPSVTWNFNRQRLFGHVKSDGFYYVGKTVEDNHCHILQFAVKLDRSFDLQARKIAASKCVRVKWKKASSGACNVSYAVALKSASGKVFYNTTKENIGKRKICSLSAYSKITDVELTVSFKGISKVAKAKVSEALITTSAPITTGMMIFSKYLVSYPCRELSFDLYCSSYFNVLFSTYLVLSKCAMTFLRFLKIHIFNLLYL